MQQFKSGLPIPELRIFRGVALEPSTYSFEALAWLSRQKRVSTAEAEPRAHHTVRGKWDDSGVYVELREPWIGSLLALFLAPVLWRNRM